MNILITWAMVNLLDVMNAENWLKYRTKKIIRENTVKTVRPSSKTNKTNPIIIILGKANLIKTLYFQGFLGFVPFFFLCIVYIAVLRIYDAKPIELITEYK